MVAARCAPRGVHPTKTGQSAFNALQGELVQRASDVHLAPLVWEVTSCKSAVCHVESDVLVSMEFAMNAVAAASLMRHVGAVKNVLRVAQVLKALATSALLALKWIFPEFPASDALQDV